jgi:hypothetical protein
MPCFWEIMAQPDERNEPLAGWVKDVPWVVCQTKASALRILIHKKLTRLFSEKVLDFVKGFEVKSSFPTGRRYRLGYL